MLMYVVAIVNHIFLLDTATFASTYVFLLSLIFFCALALFSRGHFGIGDALVLGAVAWMFGSFLVFQVFLFAMAFISIPWAVFWMIRFRKDNTLRSIVTGMKQTIPIGRVRPGMVLASDNFMHGLTDKDIERMRNDGADSVCVKLPFPFIPVIFFAYLVTWVWVMV